MILRSQSGKQCTVKGELFARHGVEARVQGLGARFGIRSIPTLVLLRDGKEVKRQAGAVQAAQIVSWVQAAKQPA